MPGYDHIDLDETNGDKMWFRVQKPGTNTVAFRFCDVLTIMRMTTKGGSFSFSGWNVRSASQSDHHELQQNVTNGRTVYIGVGYYKNDYCYEFTAR